MAVRIEAELFSRDVAFKVKSLATASAGQILQADGAGEQRASFTFDQPAGTYDITIGYFDENDGISSSAVFVNGIGIDSWVWDQDLGSALADAKTATTRTIPGIPLRPGDLLELTGMKNGGEPLRFDYADFIEAPGLPADPFRVEAEAFTREAGFKVKSLAAASADQVLQADGSGEQRASYVFDRPSGTYNLTVGYFDETDGVSSFAVSVQGSEIDSWLWDQDLGSALAGSMTAATRTISNVTIAEGDVIEVAGTKDGGEPLRFDFIGFAPVGSDPDAAAPEAVAAVAPDIGTAQAGSAASEITMTFSDNVALDVSSFDTGDITVTGPGGINLNVTGAVPGNPADGTPRSVTYTIAAPGGSWDAADNGVYSVSLEASEVFDTAGNAADAAADLASFTVAIDDLPPPPSFRREAEDFDTLAGYTVKPLSAASGGAVLQAVGGGEKAASFVFDGPPGQYDLTLGYFDENDGEARFRLIVDGLQADSFLWSQELGSPLAGAATAAARDILGVPLQTGSVIEVIGEKDGSEPARFDFIDFTGLPAGTSSGNAVAGTSGAGNVNAGIGDDTVSGGTGNDVLAGGAGDDILTGGPSNPTLGLNFTGTLTTQLPFSPPDSMGAVGRDHIAEMLNGRFSVYDKSSGTLLLATSTNQFWRDAGAVLPGSAVDPRILYDPYEDRWIATAFERTTNKYLLAASQSADPAGNWSGISLASPNFGSIDLPSLGFNADIAVVNTGPEMLVIPKGELYAGNFANARFLLADPYPGFEKYQPVVDMDNTGIPYPIYAFNRVSRSSVQAATVDGTEEFPALNVQTPDSILFGQVYDLFPPDARQPGTQTRLETIDNRFLSNLVLQEGSVWGVHHVEENGRVALHWFQIDQASNTLLADGLITDPALDLYFGSIAVNDYGDIVIGYNGSGSNQFVSSYAATAKLAQDGTVSFEETLLLQEGAAPFVGVPGFDPGTTRWGDYSATVLDPDDPYTFWTFQEVSVSLNVGGVQITGIDLLGRGTADSDTLAGGPGNDTLNGGNDLDFFLFFSTDISPDNAEPDIDEILGFQHAADEIRFVDDAKAGLSGAVAVANQAGFLSLGDSFGPAGNPGDIFLATNGRDSQIIADYDISGSLSQFDQVVTVFDTDPAMLADDIFVFV